LGSDLSIFFGKILIAFVYPLFRYPSGWRLSFVLFLISPLMNRWFINLLEGVNHMAYIDRSRDGTRTLTFYNLHTAVGIGCPNQEQDVKVVQFFLLRIYSKPKYQEFKPWGDMVVDGKCGPITRAWITKFQLDCRKHGINAMVDGIIENAGNLEGNYKSSMSHTWYAIRILNNMMAVNDQDVYKNLTTHPEVPGDMKLIFLQIQARGMRMVYEDRVSPGLLADAAI
jgi:hypothetical protein